MSWCATVPVLQAKVAAPVAEGYINMQMLYQKYKRFLAQEGLTAAVQDTWPTVNIAASFVEKLLQRFVLGWLKLIGALSRTGVSHVARSVTTLTPLVSCSTRYH
jgi:hypothetical protein